MTASRTVDRLRPFGVTVFAEITALAAGSGAVNLGQGFPDTDGPDSLLESACAAVRAGRNQYPPVDGLPTLRAEIARHQSVHYGLSYAPAGEIIVTAGATEAITAAVIGLCEPDDDVVLFEPYYDSYAAAVAMAGAHRTVVPLRHGEDGFHFDPDELRAAVSPRTRMLILNSPHNPTGKVFNRAELHHIAQICHQHDLYVVTDEVYEHLIYDGHRHIPIALLPGMQDRTLTISSAGKALNVTGWKVGWACGPANLINAVRTAKQYLSFASGTPFQHAIGTHLLDATPWIEANRAGMQGRRDLLRHHLDRAGVDVGNAQGGYFLQLDARSLGYTDALTCCRELPDRIGVAAVPTSAFCDNPTTGSHLVRLAFCKNEATLRTAAERIAALSPSAPRRQGARR